MSAVSRFPTRFGKYILLDRINSGGMAEVYCAKVTGVEEFQRLVAIKCMLPALMKDEQFLTMFVDEAKLSAQLAHANICQIYELGNHGEQLYIAMELIEGRDLRNIVRMSKAKGIPIPRGFASYVISKAAEGLDYAHNKTGHDGSPLNLVHRDVSPQNILVSYDGAVKVVDFGIAKAEDRGTETRAGVLKGKFSYMAPEQVMGEPMDGRADIFALGSVLYEILTKQKLFTGNSDLSILEKVRSAQVPAFDEALPDVPEELLDILRKSLSKSPADRFASAGAMAEALEPLLIEERTIFGPNRAKAFMHELYGAEIAAIPERNREYSQVSDADCVEDSQRKVALSSATQVFESAFSAEASGASGLSWEEDEKSSTSIASSPGTEWGGSAPPPEQTAAMPALEAADPGQVSGDETLMLPGGAAALFAPEQSNSRQPPPTDGMPRTVIDDGRLLRTLAPPPPQQASKSGGSGLIVGVVLLLVVAGLGGAWVVTQQRAGGGQARTVIEEETVALEPDAPAVTGTAVAMDPALAATAGITVSAAPKPIMMKVRPAPAGKVSPPTAPRPLPGASRQVAVAERTRRSTPPPNRRIRVERADPASPPAFKKVGYLSMRATGVLQAMVFVDSKPAGWSPKVFFPVKIGKHTLRFDEYEADRPTGRSVTKNVIVKADHTRKAPLKVFVKIE